MANFIKFMLKCIWYGSSYVFTASPAMKPHEPFAVLGIIGFCIFSASFLLSSWFVVKLKSLYLKIIVSMLISLIPVIFYFIIAYFFVR